MYRHKIQLLIVVLALVMPSMVSGQSSDKDFAEKVEKGIVQVNEMMVKKDRGRSLDAIDDVLALLNTRSSKTYQDTGEKLDRVKFFLNKYNWDRARRILKSTMEELDLTYQPTHP